MTLIRIQNAISCGVALALTMSPVSAGAQESAAQPTIVSYAPTLLEFFQSLAGRWSNGDLMYTFRNEGGNVAVDVASAQNGGFVDTQRISSRSGRTFWDRKLITSFQGGVYVNGWWAIIPVSATEFKIRAGKLKGVHFQETAKDWPVTTGIFRRLDDAETQAFVARADTARDAWRQSNASGGGGLLGAVLSGVILGAAGADMPAMHVDGSAPNALDVLNAAHAGVASRISSAPRLARDGISVASNAPAPGTGLRPAPAAPALGPVTPVAVSTPASTSSSPKICTTPGGSREWSTGIMTPLADARADYEKEASFQRAKGSSMSPMQCGKTVTVFGMASAICYATITWPEKSSSCGSTVSPQ